MRIAEHPRIAFGPLWIGAEKIWNPPGAELAGEEKAIADPQPPIEPAGPVPAQVPCAEEEPDGKGQRLHQGHNDQARASVFAPDSSNVVQTPERNPVMNQEKSNLKRLQYEQGHFNGMGG